MVITSLQKHLLRQSYTFPLTGQSKRTVPPLQPKVQVVSAQTSLTRGEGMATLVQILLE